MMWLDRTEQNLWLDGCLYTHPELMRLLSAEVDDERKDLWAFLREWFDGSPYLTVHTSGSTGKPKYLKVSKERMMNSARITCEFLNLAPGDTALLCMPLQYIAGKMMVVRALVGGLNLICRKPSGNPMKEVGMPLRFAAMVPLQVYNSLGNDLEKERLKRIDNLIIGGGAVDDTLVQALQDMPGRVYSTYGMTETLSHVALRKLNGPDASGHYIPFPSVGISLSEEGTLRIDAPLVCEHVLTTNDVGRVFSDGSFQVLGRKDNTVNSGGLKIQIEELETQLRQILDVDFALTSVPDERLGEALVLLVTGDEAVEALHRRISQHIPDRYKWPKRIVRVCGIPQTGSGKIDRAACRRLANPSY